MIMISVKPQHACNILNGIKTGELRKNKTLRKAVEKEIQEKGYCEIAMYVSKANNHLIYNGAYGWYACRNKVGNCETDLNGKVVCKFKVRRVEDITGDKLLKDSERIDKITCVDKISILKYARPNLIWDRAFNQLCNSLGGLLLAYILNIEDLCIYDKPKELSDFLRYYNVNDYNNGVETNYFLPPNIPLTTLTKSPQNYTRVFEKNIFNEGV